MPTSKAEKAGRHRAIASAAAVVAAIVGEDLAAAAGAVVIVGEDMVAEAAVGAAEDVDRSRLS